MHTLMVRHFLEVTLQPVLIRSSTTLTSSVQKSQNNKMWLIYTGTLYLLLGFKTSSGCDTSAILECVEWLQNEAKDVFRGEVMQQVIPPVELLDQQCSMLMEYQRCYKNAMSDNGSHCQAIETMRMVYRTTESTVDFMCNTGREDILLHKDCWQNDVFKSKSAECYLDATKKMLDGSITACEKMDQSQKCMFNAAYHSCGVKPAAVMTGMYNAMYSSARHTGCINKATINNHDQITNGMIEQTLDETTVEHTILPIIRQITTVSPLGHFRIDEKPCNFLRVIDCFTGERPSRLPWLEGDEGMLFESADKGIEMVCSGDYEIYPCIRRNTIACSTPLEMKIGNRILGSLMNYMCMDGKADLLRYVDCWKKIPAQKLMKCSPTDPVGILIHRKQALCQETDRFQKCVYEVIQEVCWDKPADVVKQLCNVSLDPVRRFANCGIEDTTEHPSYVISKRNKTSMGTMAAVGLMTVVFGVLVSVETKYMHI